MPIDNRVAHARAVGVSLRLGRPRLPEHAVGTPGARGLTDRREPTLRVVAGLGMAELPGVANVWSQVVASWRWNLLGSPFSGSSRAYRLMGSLICCGLCDAKPFFPANTTF